MTFKDRYGPWAVIAGASEGTGAAFARRIAAQGIHCILLARRRDPLDQLAAALRDETCVDCLTASVDLADRDASARIAEIVGSRDVGLFVANAGSDPHGSLFLDRSADDWVELAQRNVLTTIRCCHHFAVPMRARGKGGVLLVNSGACYGGGSFMSVYSGSKAFELLAAQKLVALRTVRLRDDRNVEHLAANLFEQARCRCADHFDQHLRMQVGIVPQQRRQKGVRVTGW
jgi:short-subunit dehydrogenase